MSLRQMPPSPRTSSAISFFRAQHRIEAWVLTVAGGVLVASQVDEFEPVALGLGIISLGLGVASLFRQLRAYVSIVDGELHVRERLLGSARTLALRDADRWESFEYPDQIRFFHRGELRAEFSLSPLSHSERERLLSFLAAAVPGERFGS